MYNRSRMSMVITRLHHLEIYVLKIEKPKFSTVYSSTRCHIVTLLYASLFPINILYTSCTLIQIKLP